MDNLLYPVIFSFTTRGAINYFTIEKTKTGTEVWVKKYIYHSPIWLNYS